MTTIIDKEQYDAGYQYYKNSNLHGKKASGFCGNLGWSSLMRQEYNTKLVKQGIIYNEPECIQRNPGSYQEFDFHIINKSIC